MVPFIFESFSIYCNLDDDAFSLLENLILTDQLFLNDYNFFTKYLTHIKSKPILPNVNGKYISPEGYLNDLEEHVQPVYSLQLIDDICVGELFDNLLKHTENLKIQQFYSILDIKNMMILERNTFHLY